jgi:hypothetical protein
MCGSGDDDQLFFRVQALVSLLIESNHDGVAATDDQQRRRVHLL